MKRCKHKTMSRYKYWVFAPGVSTTHELDEDRGAHIDAKYCLGCRQWLSLGEATATVLSLRELDAVAAIPGRMSNLERFGWDLRHRDIPDPDELTPAMEVGWLAHAIVHHDAEQPMPPLDLEAPIDPEHIPPPDIAVPDELVDEPDSEPVPDEEHVEPGVTTPGGPDGIGR